MCNWINEFYIITDCEQIDRDVLLRRAVSWRVVGNSFPLCFVINVENLIIVLKPYGFYENRW